MPAGEPTTKSLHDRVDAITPPWIVTPEQPGGRISLPPPSYFGRLLLRLCDEPASAARGTPAA